MSYGPKSDLAISQSRQKQTFAAQHPPYPSKWNLDGGHDWRVNFDLAQEVARPDRISEASGRKAYVHKF